MGRGAFGRPTPLRAHALQGAERIEIPAGAFVVAAGASASGKSTFVRRFPEEMVISSDRIRHELLGDASNHAEEARVWSTVYQRIHDRLGRGLSVVLDSTASSGQARKAIFEAAQQHNAPVVFLLFDTPLDVCLERNTRRQDGIRSESVPEDVLRRQHMQIGQLIAHPTQLPTERVVVLRPEQIERIEIGLVAEPASRRAATAESSVRVPKVGEPFAVIGDVHGCHDELQELLGRLDGRTVLLVGDLTDRGPDSLGVLETVRALHASGRGGSVRGNHDDKHARALSYVFEQGISWADLGTKLKVSHGLETTLLEWQRLQHELGEEETRNRARAVLAFLQGLPEQINPWEGSDLQKVNVSHGGVPAHLHHLQGKAVKPWALFGGPTGKVDDRGFPIRTDLSETHRGGTLIVHGHTPVSEPRLRNNVCNIDTGCVFGGQLTALLYPERTFVSVPARRTYFAH